MFFLVGSGNLVLRFEDGEEGCGGGFNGFVTGDEDGSVFAVARIQNSMVGIGQEFGFLVALVNIHDSPDQVIRAWFKKYCEFIGMFSGNRFLR